jgi:hypothetical protein
MVRAMFETNVFGVIVCLATLGADGPTGGFFSEDGPMPW